MTETSAEPLQVIGSDDENEGIEYDWIRCTRCFKLRKLPISELIWNESTWTCDNNTWDIAHLGCLTPQEDDEPDFSVSSHESRGIRFRQREGQRENEALRIALQASKSAGTDKPKASKKTRKRSIAYSASDEFLSDEDELLPVSKRLRSNTSTPNTPGVQFIPSTVQPLTSPAASPSAQTAIENINEKFIAKKISRNFKTFLKNVSAMSNLELHKSPEEFEENDLADMQMPNLIEQYQKKEQAKIASINKELEHLRAENKQNKQVITNLRTMMKRFLLAYQENGDHFDNIDINHTDGEDIDNIFLLFIDEEIQLLKQPEIDTNK